VLLAHDNDAPNADGEHAGELAAASMQPALQSYGAEPQRLRPRSKDWNQDLQELGLEQVRRFLRVQAVLEPVAEEPVDEHPTKAEAPVSAAREPLAESAAEESCPGGEHVQADERAKVEELLDWLRSADLPRVPFQLWPWMTVADVERFVAKLQSELSSPIADARWRAAAEDLRQLARLYRGAASEDCGALQLGHAPPRGWPGSPRANRLTVADNVVSGAVAAGSNGG
jgi:hypothetical protein